MICTSIIIPRPKSNTNELDVCGVLQLLTYEHTRQWITAEQLVNMLSMHRDVTASTADDARHSMSHHNKGAIEVNRTATTMFYSVAIEINGSRGRSSRRSDQNES